jgi:hypothetical protein
MITFGSLSERETALFVARIMEYLPSMLGRETGFTCATAPGHRGCFRLSSLARQFAEELPVISGTGRDRAGPPADLELRISLGHRRIHAQPASYARAAVA